MTKTYMPKTLELKEQWYVVDAENQVVGRLASRIAMILRGKHTPLYAPHCNMRTHVVVVNAEKVRLTGNKWLEKNYYRHTGYLGNLKTISAQHLMEKKPTEVLRKAVRGMIPHTKLGDATMTRLRLYAGPEHPHKAQQPQKIEIVKVRKG
jgi:large subunit ribosomal protein L13